MTLRGDVCTELGAGVFAGDHLGGVTTCTPIGDNHALLGVLDALYGAGPDQNFFSETIAMNMQHNAPPR